MSEWMNAWKSMNYQWNGLLRNIGSKELQKDTSEVSTVGIAKLKITYYPLVVSNLNLKL